MPSDCHNSREKHLLPWRAGGKGTSNGPAWICRLWRSCLSQHPCFISRDRRANPTKLSRAQIWKLSCQKKFYGIISLFPISEEVLKKKKGECRLRKYLPYKNIYLKKYIILFLAIYIHTGNEQISFVTHSFCYPGLHHFLAIALSLTLVPINVILWGLNMRMHRKCYVWHLEQNKHFISRTFFILKSQVTAMRTLQQWLSSFIKI